MHQQKSRRDIEREYSASQKLHNFEGKYHYRGEKATGFYIYRHGVIYIVESSTIHSFFLHSIHRNLRVLTR
ncbi:Hypothetical predicted protein [Olea europaea subsp. europaea]|uniref:Uncharacterized protein n=1 Tax=Olea europaea subsp. europaea TaxID=158383 RepID=A0A8S0UVQ1_OLEEU|nr:Hypothetical predicted protein [Olea europaea subsp. europaea]